ncbi:MAG: TetR/AcrR family transcriptional regulator [Cytophagaceae bacterium]|nr:TetR/AcrR family transcriptional regulator [Gemmatimonadaceae bacterium]
MSPPASRKTARRRRGKPAAGPRADDPRVMRTRTAVVDAARTLFLRTGYAGTTMEDIAELAGLTKRTVYNNYGDKDALFTQIVADVIAYAEDFARALHEEFSVGITAANLRAALDDLGRRLALGIVRPEVIALRRLLIAEARGFPDLATEYFDRAPGQVIDALAERFRHLSKVGLLRVTDARRAAAQFAYLVAGEPLDRAMLVGTTPPREHVIAGAKEGVLTFLARYGVARGV